MGDNIQKMKGQKRLDVLIPYLFIAPFLFSFIIFFVYPSAYSFFLSFHNYRGFGEAKFIGFRNYTALLNYTMFWSALKNTLFYFIVRFIPMMAGSFITAYFINFIVSKKAAVFYKPVIFLPQVMSIVAAALCWKVILGTEHGVINTLFNTRIGFLETSSLLKLSVVMMMLWRAFGWFVVVYMAGLTTINTGILEAAKIDGANNARILFNIIIPLMKPIFFFAFMMDAINSMKIFTEPSVLFSSAGESVIPISAEPVLSLLVSRISSGNFGFAAALGWVIFFIILLIVLVLRLVFKDREAQ